MKKLLTVSILFFATLAHAETTTYDISGMHCGGCAKMIKTEVCGMAGIEKCEVSMGKLVISPKTGITFAKEQIQSAVSKAGDYKITGTVTSK